MEKLNNTNCIFCGYPLDDSDEHIIPNCLNGRLHSKNIICQSCNTKFGTVLDPHIKDMFNPILLALGFDNAHSVYSEDPDGKKYLFDGEKSIINMKPQETKISKDGFTYITMRGNPKHLKKYFEKRIEEFSKKGYKLLKSNYKEVNNPSPLIRFRYEIEVTPKLILELNKIALEYYAYCELDIQKIKHILDKVNNLDETLNNAIFCNSPGDIRVASSGEISHLIVIRTNKNGTLYCYIELLNIICAYIKLADNCVDGINFVYYQDAINGERFNGDIKLNLDIEPINRKRSEDFGMLINSIFERSRERSFLEILNEKITEVDKQALLELENGSLSKEKFSEELANRRCKIAAELSYKNFPYLIEDYRDEENDMLNHIHSNMREERFDEFCELNKEWIGIKVTFPDDEIFYFDSFFKRYFIERNGIKLVKVYCVLVQKGTNLKRYIPYRDFYEGIMLPNNINESNK